MIYTYQVYVDLSNQYQKGLGMQMYEQLVSEAYVMVKFFFEDYKESKSPMGMFGLLLGLESCAIKVNKDSEHNYQAVIDAIHRYYNECKDEKVIEFYKMGIKKIIFYVADMNFFEKIINILSYEMFKEKKGTATFSIDIQEMLDELSNIIKENYDKIVKNKKTDLKEWLEEKSEIVLNEYGYYLWKQDMFLSVVIKMKLGYREFNNKGL